MAVLPFSTGRKRRQQEAEAAGEFHRITRFTFPDDDGPPAQRVQSLEMTGIALGVALEFSLPKGLIINRHGSLFAAGMPVPETAMHEYG